VKTLPAVCLARLKVAKFINGDAGGDGGVHRAQRTLAAGQLDLDVRASCRRGRAPSPIGHTLTVPDRPADSR